MKKMLQKAIPVTLALCMMAGLGLTSVAVEPEDGDVDNVLLISAPAEPEAGGELSDSTPGADAAVDNETPDSAPAAEEDGDTIPDAAPAEDAEGEDAIPDAAPVEDVEGDDAVTETAPAEEAEDVDVAPISAPDEEQAACPKDGTCPLEAFTDTKNDAWYHDGIHYCVENGLMNGVSDTRFDPNGTTTRAMVATILYRVAGEPAFMNDNVFSDVPAGSYYEYPVVWASGKDIVNGVGNGKFAPNDPVTREQLVTLLYRYAKYMECDVSVDEDTNFLSYNDVFDISEYAKDAVMWALSNGILQGDNKGNLNPGATATRAEVATIFQRFCEGFAVQAQPPVDDPEPVEPPVAGGWSVNTEFAQAEIPEAAQAAFDKAMEDFVGVGYTPVAYLGSQVVAGSNYAFLCTSTTVTAQPVTGLAVVVVYADLAGNAVVSDISPVTLPVEGEDLTFPEAGMAGGWNVADAAGPALPEAVQTAFDKAMEGFAGVGYTPVAYLGSQVVAGSNYAVLCKATQVTAQPSTALAVVVLYADLEGNAEVTSVSGFDFP